MGGLGSGPRPGGGKSRFSETPVETVMRLSKGFPSTHGMPSGYKDRGGDIKSGGGRGPSDATSHTDGPAGHTTSEANSGTNENGVDLEKNRQNAKHWLGLR